MKLVTMILTVVSLAACHVEEPGGSEVKAQVVEKEDLWSGALFWAEADDENIPDKLFGVLIDFRKQKAVIRAVDWDENKKEYVSAGDDCTDSFNRMKAVYTTGGVFQRYEQRKGKRYFGTKMKKAVYTTGGVFQLDDVTYEIPDSDGNIVTFKLKPGLELPSVPQSDVWHSETVPFLLGGKDCNEVSQSGEEGSAAP